ncbi:MAG: HAD family hydrolase [Xanthobacteraceae bacterium]|jgi:phosphoglycolate phosphatase
MTTFKVIAFDYDGTLFDTRPAIVHCIRRSFAASGRPTPAQETVLYTIGSGVTLEDTFLYLDESLRKDDATLRARVEAYRAIYLAEGLPLLKPFAGVSEVLRQLHADGAKCLVVSNKGLAAIRQSLDAGRLTPFIDLVLGDEPGQPNKPDPAIVVDRILPKYAQLQPRQILMVGDTEIDILFAKKSRMPCCWVSYGYGDAQRCRALKPEHEIGSIAELPLLFRRQ